MRPMAIVLPLLALVVLASLPSNASACSCTNLPDFERAYAESDAIFLGEVLEVVSAAPEYPDDVWAILRVEAHWKGAPPDTIRVLTGANEGICGFTFHTGTRYLVYAFEWTPGVLSTHLCWRTHATWPEDPDLALLGPTPVAARSWGSVKVRYR